MDATISWQVSEGVPGYRIRLGTTPGGGEISETSVGSGTSFTPRFGLPENTTIYVTIILDFLFIGSNDIVCSSQSFTTEDVTTPPNCTTVNIPNDQSTDVSVFSNISWSYAPTATGYVIRLGTSPGGGEILNNIDVGNTLNFNPPDFPPNTTLYLEIVPYNENGMPASCDEISFTTGQLAALPGCTSLLSPLNGDLNVPLTPLIEWTPVANATGYRLTIGTTPTNADILDNTVFTATSTFVIDFNPNLTFFITITPFNEAGDAIGCGQESFSTVLGCGPYLNLDTGEFETLNPELDFPDLVSFCRNEIPFTIEGPANLDGYRWFQIDPLGNERLISESRTVDLVENGDYLLEVFTLVSQFGNIIECPTSKNFAVVSSEIATIDGLDIRDTPFGLEITVNASGIGDYEYAIDNIDGPYQDSNVFSEVAPGTRTIYVRDRNGCGIAQETFEQDLTVEGFPKFFTPNGDNINDFWQFIQPIEGQTIVLVSIEIYDRYGKLLRQINQNSQGWDGTYDGRPLPAGGYWFRAVEEDGDVVQGNFTLKR
ncbi:MAG: T9SS type B sorting domain-containing protein [Bacteroidota bacterium]